MLRLRTLLVDDEPLALDLLKLECARFDLVEVVGVARDGRAAAQAIERERPDLVLLDVEMPDLDGLAVAAQASPPAPQFVFVTAHPDYAVEAFGLEATDYLLKPVPHDRMALALERVRRRAAGKPQEAEAEAEAAPLDGSDGVLWLKGPGGYVRIAHREVLWLEAERDYVRLHTAEHSYLFRSSLAAMQQRLGEAAMLQVHRSAVVRRSAIRNLRPTIGGSLRVVLANGDETAVGRSYVPVVAKTLGVPHGRARR